jgi:hypothetical protein
MASDGEDKAHTPGEKSGDAYNQENEILLELFETDPVIPEEIY